MRGLGPLILRLAVGVVFFAHGLPKLVPVWGHSPRQAAMLLELAGVASAYPLSVGLGIVELLAGLLLIAGAFTVWVTLLLGTTTAVMAWVLHVSNGFYLNWPLEPSVGHGYEFDLLLVSGLACLMLTGPGLLSYDARRAKERAWTSPTKSS